MIIAVHYPIHHIIIQNHLKIYLKSEIQTKFGQNHKKNKHANNFLLMHFIFQKCLCGNFYFCFEDNNLHQLLKNEIYDFQEEREDDNSCTMEH